MTRKVIQIAFDSHPQAINSLHALCDDGTIWVHDWTDASGSARKDAAWRRITDVPTDDPPRRLAGGFPEGTGGDRGR